MIKSVHLDVGARVTLNVAMDLVDRRRIPLLEGFADTCNQVRHLLRVQELLPQMSTKKITPDLEYLPISHRTSLANACGVYNH
jgi:hypothetical protein